MKQNTRKSVDHKCCLCQTDFSYNTGKRMVLSNFRRHLFRWQNYKQPTEINRQISSDQRCIWKLNQQIWNGIHSKWTL